MLYHFGGSITTSTSRNKIIESKIDENGKYDIKTVRNEYNYIVRSNEFERLVNYLYNVFVIKHKQMELLWKYMSYVNIPDKKDIRKNFMYNVKNLIRPNMNVKLLLKILTMLI